ncbi:hypothetical protein PVK06_023634 [Gossypium arboreum]|uniref:Uncharacterized protein n=1 Tax=Gossypium arboreum TaxID=29729 RepID=A0ABR0PBW8_GOSAR|nr:hypothetical protein PVK06_023634 [Gossypium arboreum]
MVGPHHGPPRPFAHYSGFDDGNFHENLNGFAPISNCVQVGYPLSRDQGVADGYDPSASPMPWRTKPRARVYSGSDPCISLLRIGDLHASDYSDYSGSHVNTAQRRPNGDGTDSFLSSEFASSCMPVLSSVVSTFVPLVLPSFPQSIDTTRPVAPSLAYSSPPSACSSVLGTDREPHDCSPGDHTHSISLDGADNVSAVNSMSTVMGIDKGGGSLVLVVECGCTSQDAWRVLGLVETASDDVFLRSVLSMARDVTSFTIVSAADHFLQDWKEARNVFAGVQQATARTIVHDQHWIQPARNF